MNHLVFQRMNGDERRQAISQQIDQFDSTVIVFSTSAARLAKAPQPPSRNAHQVVKLLLDPEAQADTFNPLDVLRRMDLATALPILLEPLKYANPVTAGSTTPSGLRCEPAWQILASELLESLISHRLRRKQQPISLIETINLFFSDDVTGQLAQLLDNDGKFVAPNIYAVISNFLKRTDAERSAILSIVQGSISRLNTIPAQRDVERTTFDLDLLTQGRGTVYVEIPPQLDCSRVLVTRLWLSAFLQLATASVDHQDSVSFIVDNASGLEVFPQLLAAQRTLTGAASVWSFWESLEQLRARYPADWSAFVGSCRTVQALGPQSPTVAAALADAFAVSAVTLSELSPGRSLTLAGAPPDPVTPAAMAPKPERSVQRGHLITFAPAHADKWEQAAPALLERAESSLVVIESAGRCYELTAESRAAMGRVVRLDPFEILGEPSDQFNPLDLLKTERSVAALDVYQFAELLVNVGGPSVDLFWNHWAISLIRAVLQYIRCVPEKAQNLSELWKIFHSDDVVYNLAVVLDTIGKQIPAESYKDISMFLQLADITRSRVLVEVTKSLVPFGFAPVQRVVEQTTFDLDWMAQGRATVYVEVPPELSGSHVAVTRLWLSALLQLAAASDRREHSILFVVDNASGLEVFPQLLAAQQSPAGTIEVWSFWESLGQLSARHPADWSAFVSSSRTVQAWGPQSPTVAAELANAFGASAAELSRISPGSSLTLSGEGSNPVAPVMTSNGAPREERGHTVSFAPAHADKWRGVAQAVLGQEESSVVIVESAGRCYELTAPGRAAMGHVVRLDPFGVVGEPSDQFNPLGLLKAVEPSETVEALLFAELLVPQDPSTIDPYWRSTTISLIHALLIYLATLPEDECSLMGLRRMFLDSDSVHNLKKILDAKEKELPLECRQLLAIFLSKADMERTSILAQAHQSLLIFGDPLTAAAVEKSSFDFRDLINGVPLTIYIEIPRFRVHSHQLLAQLWLRSLLALGTSGHSSSRVHFILDSPFSKELFPLLRRVQGSLDAEVWTFWESLDQLRRGHPTEWSAFLANAQRVEVIGPQNPVVSADLAQVFGHSQQTLQALPQGQSMALHEYPSATSP